VLGWVWDKMRGIINLGKGVGSFIGNLLGAGSPAAGKAAPDAAAAGYVRGAAGLRMGAGPVTAAAGSMGTIGSSGGAGMASVAPMVVQVTIQGAVDPMASGRQLVALLDEYSRQTGRSIAVAVS